MAIVGIRNTVSGEVTYVDSARLRGQLDTGVWVILDVDGDGQPDPIGTGTGSAATPAVTVAQKVGGVWPTSWDGAGTPSYAGGGSDSGKRPTSSDGVTVMWIGADPAPPIVSSGDAGMRDGIDLRLRTP